MTATAIQPNFEPLKVVETNEKRISWEMFQLTYARREDGYKYEWLNGIVEKTKKTIDYTQLFIQKNLTVFFYKCLFEGKLEGQLLAEGDMFFIAQHRRPDMTYLTDKQVDDAADGVKPSPKFVIEIVSDSDAINRVYKKMQDYRAANVQVAWLIFPQLHEVHIHYGDNLDLSCTLSDEQICSAFPVLPTFEMSVNEILKRAK